MGKKERQEKIDAELKRRSEAADQKKGGNANGNGAAGTTIVIEQPAAETPVTPAEAPSIVVEEKLGAEQAPQQDEQPQAPAAEEVNWDTWAQSVEDRLGALLKDGLAPDIKDTIDERVSEQIDEVQAAMTNVFAEEVKKHRESITALTAEMRSAIAAAEAELKAGFMGILDDLGSKVKGILEEIPLLRAEIRDAAKKADVERRLVTIEGTLGELSQQMALWTRTAENFGRIVAAKQVTASVATPIAHVTAPIVQPAPAKPMGLRVVEKTTAPAAASKPDKPSWLRG